MVMKRDLSLASYKLNSIYYPKTDNQKKYVEYLDNDKTSLVVAVGPAGCGKTLFACIKAINLMKSGSVNKIIITRPTVSVVEELGFLPGNLVKKMDPWTRPIIDIFSDYYQKYEIDNMLHNNIIEICPLAFMRGRTFKNSFIIADEMQNSTPNQMLMVSTRIGINSKIVITGDLKQSDKMYNNGLFDFINKYEKYPIKSERINMITFDKGDIERSKLVQDILNIYEYNPITNKNTDCAIVPSYQNNDKRFIL
jgi:phosphate starvation-inducible PhoH-like protein